MSKHKQHAPEFKAKGALEAPKGEETVTELANSSWRPVLRCQANDLGTCATMAIW